MSNKKIIMTKKPIGFPEESNFKLIDEGSIDLKANEVRLQTLWLSLDPVLFSKCFFCQIYFFSLLLGILSIV